jgi:hypothetical protein
VTVLSPNRPSAYSARVLLQLWHWDQSSVFFQRLRLTCLPDRRHGRNQVFESPDILVEVSVEARDSIKPNCNAIVPSVAGAKLLACFQIDRDALPVSD